MTPGDELIVEQLARELPSAEFGVETPKGLVFHYTDAAGLLGIAKTGMVWATHYRHLNDRRELIEGESLVKEVAASMRGTLASDDENQLLDEFLRFYDKMVLSRVNDAIYVASFSEAGDDLAQWRAYGARGGGYSIGVTFDVPPEEEEKKADERGLGQTMRKVRYERDPAVAEIKSDLAKVFHGIRRYGRTFHGHAELVKEIYTRGMVIAYVRAAQIAVAFKHEAFVAEREWRLVATLSRKADPRLVSARPSPHGIVPYLELDLKPGKPRPIQLERIVVGPTQDPERGIHSTKLYLRSVGYDQETVDRIVVPSNVPFRG